MHTTQNARQGIQAAQLAILIFRSCPTPLQLTALEHPFGSCLGSCCTQASNGFCANDAQLEHRGPEHRELTAPAACTTCTMARLLARQRTSSCTVNRHMRSMNDALNYISVTLVFV